MRFLSVCSGIEAASVAWNPLGWEAAAFSEIEPFPCSVLAHHYPTVPNRGDMTKFQDWPDESIDLLCGGTPCQSFSVAGLRKGLADPRGNLMLTFGAIAAKYRPRWLVWENVPGVLSSNAGADFGAFLGMLGQLGYGFAYRVLDAQFFGVAQRRRRVFVVGCLGDWRSAAAVLFERHSLSGHPAPRREAGQRVAPTIAGCANGGGANGPGRDVDSCDSLIPERERALTTSCTRIDAETETLLPLYAREVAQALTSNYGKQPDNTDTALGPNLVAFDTTQMTSAANRSNPKPGDPCHPLAAGAHAPAIAFPANLSGTQHASTEDLAPSMGAANPTAVALSGSSHASTFEADASSLLRALRERVGAEAVAEWGSRILGPLQSPEVLRAWLHGESIRRASGYFRSFVDDCPLPREEGVAAGAMRSVWEDGPDGCTPQGRGLAKQLAHQLGKALSELPSARAPQQSGTQVRRLTPRECERLMGFPDDYTLIQHRNKPAADGPRYKALGNSWAVPCARWIGERIQAVEAITTELEHA